MKISLVFPPYYLESMYNLPPLGLVNLATAIRAGSSLHQLALIDFVLAIRQKTLKLGKRIYDDCAKVIMQEDPDLVALSAQCTTYPAVIRIASRLKEMKRELVIVVGGHNASFVDEETLARHPAIDAIVRGEGERTFPELVEALEHGASCHNVAGVTYREKDRIIRNKDRELITDLDDLPLPDYRFLPPFAAYRDACEIPRSIVTMEVGRGCPHHCIYCSESIMWRRRTRTFSVDRLISEMAHLHTEYGAQCFLLAYDQFTANQSFVKEFCKKVVEAGLNHIPWYCISRLDSVDGALLETMRRAGCESMCYGIDSGSKKTLSFIRKNIDQNLLYRRVKETTEQQIVPTLSFVIGFPEEKKEDLDDTLRLALRTGILGNCNVLIQMATILPGTDLYRRYLDRLTREVDTYFSLGLEFDHGKRLAADEALIDADPALFSSFYNLPCPAGPLKELDLIASYFCLVVNLYPMSFLLLSRECQESISDLFLRWLRWLAREAPREELSLSPQDCYECFALFAGEVLQEKKTIRFRHIEDVLRYETLALEVGKLETIETPFHIDIHLLRELRPLRHKKSIVEQFTFNLDDIIVDLKQGVVKMGYPSQPCHLVFRLLEGHLDVTEINDFGFDFLQLSDGENTFSEICHRLHPRYGSDKSVEEFFSFCVEAVQCLTESGLVEVEQS